MGLSLVCLFMLVLVGYGVGLNDVCQEARCKKHGPVIRFPFRLRDKQPDHCGYPGFDLSCTDRKETLLELPTSVKLNIKKIDYAAQLITATDPDNCLPKQLRNLSLSTSLFKFASHYVNDYALFNCTSWKDNSYTQIRCLSGSGYDIYAYGSDSIIGYTDLTSCTKIYNLSSIPDEIVGKDNSLQLKWSGPACGANCEARGKFCRRKNNTARYEIECYDKPKSNKGIKKKIAAAVTTVGSVLLLVETSPNLQTPIAFNEVGFGQRTLKEEGAVIFISYYGAEKNLSLEMDLSVSVVCLFILGLVGYGVGLEDLCQGLITSHQKDNILKSMPQKANHNECHGVGLKDPCQEARCKKHGPVIRFPFRLKGKQPGHCGFSGFDLSCTDRKQTLLGLPTSVKLYINNIDYASQLITATDPENCLPRQLLKINLSTSPFKFAERIQRDVDLFNCTSRQRNAYLAMPCLSVPGFDIYDLTSGSIVADFDLTSCTKMYNLLSIPNEIHSRDNILHLNWSRPACGLCGAQGKLCRLKNNTARLATECYDKPKSNEVVCGEFRLVMVEGVVRGDGDLARRVVMGIMQVDWWGISWLRRNGFSSFELLLLAESYWSLEFKAIKVDFGDGYRIWEMAILVNFKQLRLLSIVRVAPAVAVGG
ncbi:unnamed protein product [Dovyalis caffra]|uniref:RING-type E3 ubiquitin transferase n=1 Tax=Dovyalis caffra TaxID=77055 RepID=A0AAV1QTK7_9ROSI|nr:unnamed protein product [Dovyalis caffra]